MVTHEQHAVSVRAGEGATRSGVLYVVRYDKNERMRRSLKTLSLFWALAVASVPIVIAHFVLVPGFLIAGPVLALRKFNVETALEKALAACPACDKELSLALEPADVLPKWTYCPLCNAPLQLTLEGGIS